MNKEALKVEAGKVAANAEKILSITTDERRVFASIKDLGKKIYLSNAATAEDIELITSRALALLAIMRTK